MTRDKCPAHYSFSDLQPWDVIDAWGVDYYLGNVLKYICRAGRKSPDRLVDLNKALHYLQKEVELAERELAESCAFTSPRKTTEDTTEDTTEETPPSWEGRVWSFGRGTKIEKYLNIAVRNVEPRRR
jgi:hypothetical protein